MVSENNRMQNMNQSELNRNNSSLINDNAQTPLRVDSSVQPRKSMQLKRASTLIQSSNMNWIYSECNQSNVSNDDNIITIKKMIQFKNLLKKRELITKNNIWMRISDKIKYFRLFAMIVYIGMSFMQKPHWCIKCILFNRFKRTMKYLKVVLIIE